MDDHMLDRIAEDINICFQCAELELGENEDIKENNQYKAAAVLIKAYNALAKLYYIPEYAKRYSKGNVNKEYKLYLDNKN